MPFLTIDDLFRTKINNYKQLASLYILMELYNSKESNRELGFYKNHLTEKQLEYLLSNMNKNLQVIK